jgi:hypothetical protein
MCDIDRIGGLIAAAQLAILAVLTFLGIAILNSSNLFTAWASTGLMIAALVSTGVAIGALTAAAALLGSCTTGPCAAAARFLLLPLTVMITGLSGVAVAIAFGTAISAIPWVGAVAVAVILAGFLGVVSTSLSLGHGLGDLITCLRRTGTPPQTGLPDSARTGAYVLGFIIVFALAVMGVDSGRKDYD